MSATTASLRHHPIAAVRRAPRSRARARSSAPGLTNFPPEEKTAFAGSGSAAGNEHRAVQFGFTGRYLDKETNLWYFRARYYSGTLGRFISRDPVRRSKFIPRSKDGYKDGYSLYRAYFIPVARDPYGLYREVTDKAERRDPGAYLPIDGDVDLSSIIDPEFLKNRLVAKAEVKLQYHEPGKEKCGEPLILTLTINTGNVPNTENYFDVDMTNFIVRASQDHLESASGDMAKNTYTVVWKIPTICEPNSDPTWKCCKTKFSEYYVEYSREGNTNFKYRGDGGPGDPTFPADPSRVQYFKGIEIKPAATILGEKDCTVNSSSGGVKFTRFANGPGDFNHDR